MVIDRKSFQTEFYNSIARPPFDHSEELLFEVIPAGTLSKSAALQVYRTGYLARLTESLGETYEAIWWVLGDEVFFQLSKDYIEKMPSETRNLNTYGERFPEFLKTHSLSTEIPFLFELSKLEWELKSLFYKKGTPPVNFSSLLNKPDFLAIFESGEISFQFHPDAVLINSPFPIYSLWKLLKESPQRKESTLAMNQEESFLMAKPGEMVEFYPLSSELFNLTSQLKKGKTLTDALDSIDGVKEGEIQHLIQILIQSGGVDAILTE